MNMVRSVMNRMVMSARVVHSVMGRNDGVVHVVMGNRANVRHVMTQDGDGVQRLVMHGLDPFLVLYGVNGIRHANTGSR